MRQLYLRRLLVFTLSLLLGTASFSQVVISQVYGGAGCTTANCSLYKNDYIELFNPTNAPVSLEGWSVQYASAIGTSWSTTALSGTIQPGQYYLVAEGGNNNGTNNLPTPDKSGGLNMAATAGKVALVRSTAALTGTPCPTSSNIADMVGYGSTATCYEGAGAAPTFGGNSNSIFRLKNGCTDSDNNSSDFTAGPASPRNTATTKNPCGLSGVMITTSSLPAGVKGQSYSVSFEATGGATPYTFSLETGTLPSGLSLSSSGTLSGTPTEGGMFNFSIKAVDKYGQTDTRDFTLSVAVAATIAEIQGPGNTSPLKGYTVSTTGIVTGVKSSGFFIQMPGTGDGNAATSDAVFVYTGGKPGAEAAVGNLVEVAGTVSEYGTTTASFDLTNTEINSPSVTLLSTGNTLPPAVTLTTADLTASGGLYQLEEYEGMRVQVASLTVVAPTGGNVSEKNATATSDGLFYAVITGTARPFREQGMLVYDALPAGAPTSIPRWDGNPELITVASHSLLGSGYIDVATHDVLTNVSGVLDYGYDAYTIDLDPTAPPTMAYNNTGAQKLPAPAADEFTVASFNMERFYDDNDDAGGDTKLTADAYTKRLSKASLAVRNVLNYPDILCVVEMEKLSVLQTLATRINSDAVAAGHPNPGYVAYLEEGNDIGGIDVGFLVKSSKVTVQKVEQYGKDATYTEPSGTVSMLNDRPPLVLTALVTNPACKEPFPITVIVNHLRSLLSMDDPVTGPRVRAKRRAQAEYLAHLIQELQTKDPHAHIVSVGDYNAFQFNDGYVDVIGTIKGAPAPATEVLTPSQTITSPALTNLMEQLPETDRYSYSFGGNAQVIDHVLVSQALYEHFSTMRVAHLNADYPEVWRSDASRPERLSDHDAPVAYFRFPADTEAPVITGESTSVTTLTPVNHKMRDVTINYEVTDNCDTDPSTTLTVTSNEPSNGLGDGNTAADWEVVDAHTVRLRAERSGTAGGRTYTITITATDDAGNKAEKTLEVKVPHNAISASLTKGAKGGSVNRAVATDEETNSALEIRVLPNPSTDRFTLVSKSASTQPLSIRVTDAVGRVVESRRGLPANGSLQLGSTYRPGVYYVEVVQGEVRQTIRLVKQAK